MKALLIKSYVSSLSDLTISEVPDPIIPPPQTSTRGKNSTISTQVLVQITHTALNHVDILYAKGLHQNNHSGLVSPPFILGLEFAGVVISTTSNTTTTSLLLSGSQPKFKKGDLVWGSSTNSFAEQILVPESALHHLPRGWTLSDVDGLGAATAPVSYGALVKVGGLRPGQVVLVHAAAGGLGVVAVQIAVALGASVIGTVGSERKADVVRQLGERLNRDVSDWKAAANARGRFLGVVRYDVDGWEKEVKALSDGQQGVDLVYDTVGLVEKSIRCLKFSGAIVVAGFAGLGGKMERLAMNRVLLKNVKLLGYRYGESGRRDPTSNQEIWVELTQLLENGIIKPIIYDQVFTSLESVPKALEELEARKVWGKAVVKISPGHDMEDSDSTSRSTSKL